MLNVFFAIILLIFGYYFRMLRTMSILRPYINTPFTGYWHSLALGYLFEFFFPFRIYDLVRTLSFAKISRVSWEIPLAATVIERTFDFLFLSLILYFLSLHYLTPLLIFFILLLVFVLLPTILLKKFYYFSSSIFNDRIRTFLLSIYWSIFRIRNDLTLKKFIYISFISMMVWVCYFLSIYFLAQTILDIKTIVYYQFVQLQHISIWNIFHTMPKHILVFYFLYIFVPIFLSFLIAYLIKDNSQKQYHIAPYSAEKDSLDFYNTFFTGLYTDESELYYKLTNSGTRLADLSAASDAKTFLIEDKDKVFIRKIALNTAKQKLKLQFQWLQEYSHLPIPKIYDFKESDHLFVYDMEYFLGNNFFTTIHLLPVEDSFDIIQKILLTIQNNYREQKVNIKEFTDHYFKTKLLENRDAILQNQIFDELSNHATLLVNGLEVPNILHEQTLAKMSLYNDTLSYPIYQIHGDLTIENILVNINKEYIIIDPSPHNINIFAEYAKLFQSLHAKYEHVKNSSFEYQEKKINYAQYATLQYEKLFEMLQEFILQKHGKEGLKTTYFYEAICHIRTTSYMVKLKDNRALLMIGLAGKALKKWQEEV
ncbi:MAG: lysylphosphatidylglycerol synthase domain-containing protein [Brevinema sp.]